MFKDIRILVLLAFTLGLAPFFPEPHLVGKVRWILGGGVGMQTMDYLDLLFHGAPWVLLALAVMKKVKSKRA